MGQTARAVLDPRYRFERIVSFEPAPPCWPSLEAIDDPRFELCGFGLWSETCRGELYDPGNPAASVFPDYLPERRISEEVASIGLVRASDWLATNIGDGEVVFMKLNCDAATATCSPRSLSAPVGARGMSTGFETTSTGGSPAGRSARLEPSGVAFPSGADAKRRDRRPQLSAAPAPGPIFGIDGRADSERGDAAARSRGRRPVLRRVRERRVVDLLRARRHRRVRARPDADRVHHRRAHLHVHRRVVRRGDGHVPGGGGFVQF